MEHVAINNTKMDILEKLYSCCFEDSPHPTSKREDVSPDVIKIADFILPGYDILYQKRIKTK